MTSCQAFYCTNEKGKCEKILFCNYGSGLSLSTHRPVTTKNTGKYDSNGDKKEKKHVYAYNELKLTVIYGKT